MAEVRLGRMLLRHCPACGVPILRQRDCPSCGERTAPVSCTPPGDIRPASSGDLSHIGELVDSQYGNGGFAALCSGASFAIMNSAPALDLLDELILEGVVVGALSFDPEDSRWRFLPRAEGGRRLLPAASKGWVVADEGALRPIAEGGSLLAPGVPAASPEVRAGDEVLVLTERWELVGVGRARMDGPEMVGSARGMAVKVRQRTDLLPDDEGRPAGAADRAGVDRAGKDQAGEHATIGETVERLTSPESWDRVLGANAPEMDRMERRALKFIRRVHDRRGLPVVVSYSGGKDSLACLLLALEAGLSPTMLFLDTGLEFPSTLANVKQTAERYGTPLVTVEAGNAFWRNLPYFGPPGRDFRWCCKTCKLGPASRAVAENFPGGMLAFIGQRSYESIQRSRKGAVWENPWVKGQVGASPIQDWTALHVWLYIRSKGARYNPLYDRGFSRIGCYLCPATSLAELDIMRRAGIAGEDWVPEGLADFYEYLERYAQQKGKPEGWREKGLWRWRTLPPAHKEILSRLGPPSRAPREDADQAEGPPSGPLRFRASGGLTDCERGLSLEGAFDRPLPLDRVARWLSVLGAVTRDHDAGAAETQDGDVTVYAEGAAVVKGPDGDAIRKTLELVKDLVFRAAECAGCGACLSRCDHGAMGWDDGAGVASIDASACVHCGECLGPCPVTGFRAEEEFEL